MFLSYKNSIFTAGIASLLSLGNWMLASPSYAITLDLTTWDKIGDVQLIASDQAQASSGTIDTVFTSGGDGSLEDFLGIDAGSLNSLAPESLFGATQGSAIKTLLTNVQVGDTFSFNWNLQPGSDSFDKAFVTINNQIFSLDGDPLFNYSFLAAGDYIVGIGIVDIDDAAGESQLIVRTAKFQAVPEPLTILGVFTGISCGLVMRFRFSKK